VEIGLFASNKLNALLINTLKRQFSKNSLSLYTFGFFKCHHCHKYPIRKIGSDILLTIKELKIFLSISIVTYFLDLLCQACLSSYILNEWLKNRDLGEMKMFS